MLLVVDLDPDRDCGSRADIDRTCAIIELSNYTNAEKTHSKYIQGGSIAITHDRPSLELLTIDRCFLVDKIMISLDEIAKREVKYVA